MGRRYGVLEQEKGEAKLTRSDQLESRQKGKEMMIESHKNSRSEERLKAFQPDVRERKRSRDRGIDYGGL